MEIEAQLMGRSFGFTIPTSEFAAMDWPIMNIGPCAVTYPKQKEDARTAIQLLSVTHDERQIYTHTGWRKIDGNWAYIHAGGAISAGGALDNCVVRFAGSLNLYELRLPADPAREKAAMRASLRLAELGPPSVSFPLRAGTCRSVFPEVDFSLHLAGKTGVYKSERAALEQQHFGAKMDRKNLPALWLSTANALEAVCYSAKDTLTVIDDFAPRGAATDVARLHANADRVFRGIGNNAARLRLNAGAVLREGRPARGFVLSTGEDIPAGHSIRGRLMILEVAEGEISKSLLTECQSDGTEGLYAESMGGFIRWIAPRYEELRAQLRTSALELRQKAIDSFLHARTPDIIANLQAAFDMYLTYAEDVGAITSVQRNDLKRRCWTALLAESRQQALHQAASDPASRFIVLLSSALVSGRAHLSARSHDAAPAFARRCGWRDYADGQSKYSRPQGECIGWIDGEDIYLDPTGSYRIAQLIPDGVGERLPASEQTLRKRLREGNLLASTDEARKTLTIRRTIAGTAHDVLHLTRTTLLPEEDEPAGMESRPIEPAQDVQKDEAEPVVKPSRSVAELPANGVGYSPEDYSWPGRKFVK
jgi:hypothetical protein